MIDNVFSDDCRRRRPVPILQRAVTSTIIFLSSRFRKTLFTRHVDLECVSSVQRAPRAACSMGLVQQCPRRSLQPIPLPNEKPICPFRTSVHGPGKLENWVLTHLNLPLTTFLSQILCFTPASPLPHFPKLASSFFACEVQRFSTFPVPFL